MSAATRLLEKIRNGQYDNAFATMYGKEQIEAQRARYSEAVDGFVAAFGDSEEELTLYSAPGRTEISGNHTDHNYGRVIAGSVNLDVIAVVRQSADTIRVQSAGFPLDTVALDTLTPVEAEKNKSASLIRGTAARFRELSHTIGGFDAYTTSNVLKGSGLSSSAAFEVLIGVILNHLYNDGRISPVEIAQIAQYAENAFFGKPCGLMDQMASSVGNIITIDFADPTKPIIEKIDFDFAATGHALCIVDVGGNHADLTNEYAAIPGEMKAVAASLGAPVLRQSSLEAVMENIDTLREKHGDRAVLRAIHFFNENKRVDAQIKALKAGDFEQFKKLAIASGNSSFILHKKPAGVLKSILDKEEDVEISFDAASVEFRFGNTRMICRLIVGKYPKYRDVIPQNNSNVLKIDRVQLLNTVRRVSVCANKASNHIKLDLMPGQLEITAQDLGFATAAYEKIMCDYNGEVLTIGFKSSFLIEILSNMSCGNLVIKFADSRRAALIMPSEEESESEKLCGILMPIMVS